MAYRQVLVAYDGTSEGDEAIVAADLMAHQDQTRLTIVVVVELEKPQRLLTRWPRQTGVWNDVLLDRARADLDRAARLVEAPAELTVLFGPPPRAPRGSEGVRLRRDHAPTPPASPPRAAALVRPRDGDTPARFV
jgi:nucleotide-binding universal stress UspA family protein